MVGLPALCVWYLALASVSVPTPSAQKVQYFVEWAQKGLSVEVHLNGVDLAELDMERTSSHGGGLVNMWLKPGKNHLQVRATKAMGKEAASGPNASAAPTLTVSVWSQNGDDKSSHRVLGDFTWPPAASGSGQALEKELVFVPEPPPPSALWTKARPIELSGDSRAKIVGAVRDLHRAMAARSADRVMALTEFRDQEMARVLYLPVEQVRASRKEDFLPGAHKVWKVAPLDERSLELTLVEDGALVAVTLKRNPPIRVGLEENTLLIPVYVADIDGRFVLAR
jgi:hypothetical protein